MSFFKKGLIAALSLVFACNFFVFGYDPPKGGFFLPSLYSPWGLSSTPTVTGTSSPWASVMNPSAMAGSQLYQIEASYTGITDFGAGTQGWGSAANVAFCIPTSYGVWGGSAQFFSSPASMTSMPLGTFGTLRANFSKDLLPNLYIGSALELTLGGNGSFGWGAGLDLGLTHFVGDWGFYKDVRWGISLLNIGKGYSTATPPAGIFGTLASSYPSAFTLGLGIRGYLIQSYNWNLDAGLDLWSPAFQDLSADVSLGLGFRDYVSLRLGWTVGLRDSLESTGRSLVPSIGISGTIPLDKGISLFGGKHRDASLSPSIAVAPLYDSLYAVSAGFNLSFGIVDKTPPAIDAKLPVPYRGIAYISPNGDGQQDTLEIPVSISDERYVAGWQLKIEDKSSGKVVKAIGESNGRVETLSGFPSLGKALLFSKNSVDVPASIVWDGRDDQGAIVPDGPYTVSLVAWDDNGNYNLDYQSCMTVVVDGKKPQASVKPLESSMIFSPDGDGSKDTLSFRNTGSVENNWKIEIADSSGKVVRTQEYKERSAPRDFSWDGTTNAGTRVPDGPYVLRLVARDEAGNMVEGEVKNIIVDTSRPAVAISTDEAVMSPNGDGVKDALHITTSVESFEGLESWMVFVLDPERKNVWSVSGGAGSKPEQSYLFSGLSTQGAVLADGQYEAGIELSYINGYKPQKLSAPFYMDRTPPSAEIALSDNNRVFSPDGDGSRDSYVFTFASSEEDTWNLIIRDKNKNEKVVQKFATNLPGSYEWNGKDDQGKVVPDGDYEVYVFSVDRAGNSFATSSDQVRVDTRRPAVSLTPDREAFSPNNDGVAESVTIIPKIETKDGLVSWKFSVSRTNGGSAGWSASGDDAAALADRYVFTGKDNEGVDLPEGRYKASLELSYINGYSAKIESKEILLDRTYPVAQAKADKAVFNPAGSAGQSRVTITQTSSEEELWTALLSDSKNTVVKKWTFAGALPSLVWDGKGDSGLLVPDGRYSYVASSTDSAGNSFKTKEIAITVDTLKKDAKLSVDTLAFSPNGDRVKDVLTLSAEATASSGASGWNVWIGQAPSGAGASAAFAGKTPVKSWQGAAALPGKFEWDGMSDSGLAAPDGAYMGYFSISYPNGDVAETSVGPFVLDRVAPKASVKSSVGLFSPNGDGVLDTVTFTQEGVPGDVWQGTISTEKGEILRRWTWKDRLETFTWDGKDETGAVVPDGAYYYELASADAAGNSYSSGKLAVRVETEKKAVRLDVDQRAFSPNGDGIRDELMFGAIVQAPERVKNYEMRIVAQEGQMALNSVRVWKGNGAVPQKFIWKGETDAGMQAPDGRYAASMTVSYLNGDEVDSSTPVFLLDTVAPKIDASASLEIISPNGDGRSDTVEIRQVTVPGDDWVGRITAPDGRAVRTYSWKSEAKSFVWDGKDETGAVVKDGQYQYRAESTDSAGNRTVSPVLRIAVETEKKAVRLDTNTLAFSPNGDGVKDSIVFGVQAQYPDRIKSYELVIIQAGVDVTALPVKSWKGTGDIATQYSWDGATDSGIQAPDGYYRARLTVLYRNDDVFVNEVGPLLVDRVAPQATVRVSTNIFSPNGDGRSDTVDIVQDATPGDTWQGQIVSADSKIVRSWAWDKQLSSITWDGKNQAGALVPDGMYYYELRSIDEAGNSFVSPRLPIEVDAAKKAVRLDVDQKAFSPNGDGVKDQLYINIQAPKPQSLKEFDLSIFALDASGNRQAGAVKSWKGADIHDQYSWDGKADSGISAPDGRYQVSMRLLYANDDLFSLSSTAVLLDTVAPKISVSAAPLLFSPNGDGNKDTVAITQNSVPGDDWTGRIKNAAGTIVRTWSWKSEAKSLVWDGKDSSGAIVRDGTYTYEVSSTDLAGNTTSASVSGITVDATKPRVYVTASDTGISPNGDGIRDEVSFTLVVEKREGIESWRFSLADKQGVERSYFGGSGSEVPARLVWDGRDLQGQVTQGEYVGTLVVRYAKGDVAQASSTPIVVDIDPPKVDISVSPEYFSPDGDGSDDTLSFGIAVDNASGIIDWKLEVMETAIVESSAPESLSSERLFIDWGGKGKPPAKITWDGKSSRGELVESATDYPFKFVAHDALGNSTTVTGIVAVDVLVIRDGDRLKIKVPSIVFRANYADFVGLPSDIIARNEKVVARIAQILNKFPDYKIRIEGHANNVGKMLGYSASRIQTEETKELIPLSTGRAELVRTMLIQNGVDARRLSVTGLGSSEPVVSFTDIENRWKNRRVEFILIKNQ